MVSLFNNSSNKETESTEILEKIEKDLRRIAEAEETANKQRIVSNTLKFLETQLASADSIMTVDDIKRLYGVMAKDIFANYESSLEDKINSKLKEER